MRDRLAAETTKERDARMKCDTEQDTAREQQTVQSQLPLLQQCSIQAKIRKFHATCIWLHWIHQYASNNFSLQEPLQAFLPKYIIVRLSSSAVYLFPVDDVHLKILECLAVCERVFGGRTAMQGDRLVMVLPGNLCFHRLQTTLLHIVFAHAPS